ncbi:hypothetical protein CQW49_21270 (plasmid) [Methylosinus trichosporium OB3b]|uniref:Uncharacterized protein n=1 Tax=Methylosinus trichosporium (strain ATCC 35070 / NCIMB 11131 / UNIQEM 75 / OB3b) TaxID=595536 RepID=A0A2D2D696_METT3|nr:hypothetical protein CQW49_21270 [Methylosinus trichosporium OB3b]
MERRGRRKQASGRLWRRASARKSTKRAVFRAFLLLTSMSRRGTSAFGCVFKRPIYNDFQFWNFAQ